MTPRPRPVVERLVRTAVSQSGRYSALRLDKNERCTAWPASVVRAMLRGLSGHHLAAYPEPGRLCEKLAKHHGVGTDQLAVTAGSELAIRYLFEAFLDPGDGVVLLDPSFAMFDVYARLYGARVSRVSFDRRFRVDPDAILRAIGPRTRIVALANPNNPTGTVLDEQALVAVLRRADRHGALVLVDEAYFHFYGQSILTSAPRRGNLVVTRTFSKACGLAGVRLGYALGEARVIMALNKVQPIDHVNVFAVRLGEYLLDHPELIEDYVAQVEAGKRVLLRALDGLGLPAKDGFANFVLVDFGGAREAVIRRLYGHGVCVGAALRLPFPSGFVRITAGPAPTMRRVAAMVAEAWEAVAAGSPHQRPS